jgi:hypothetical protein
MLVLCPSCGACAVSEPLAASSKPPGSRRLVCKSCGLMRQRHPERATPRRSPIGYDPYFRLPYWLVARCRHGVVYAMNEEQVAYLESFIAAGLRERSRGAHGWANSSYVRACRTG